MDVESGAIGTMLWIRLGTWGTRFELTENKVGISWEHIGNKKIQHPHTSLKEKKIWVPWVEAASPHRMQEYFLPFLCALPFKA
jgi:hypothetical protein